jgi:hypothetical protein
MVRRSQKRVLAEAANCWLGIGDAFEAQNAIGISGIALDWPGAKDDVLIQGRRDYGAKAHRHGIGYDKKEDRLHRGSANARPRILSKPGEDWAGSVQAKGT